ncbi:nicotinamide-nucleotide amidase [Arboricoccus pini]|uniref:Nicotinamide-nucleotide amidase n=1 Tax=Arboricoccus pini TaxID=1963835 RepID=A0A212QNW0_9PROT|nr:CinA family protein [Arboricoccus pini]SNB61093.1 nicotinamide-nucleotide amidase [Arboricoccus pini]
MSPDNEELCRSLLARCRARHWTLATAESCTGGLIIARLTDFAGSSDVIDRGFVTYSNAAKTEMLGVDATLIASLGAVSKEVACAMAAGARRTAAVDLAIAVTGIAGPGGGSPAKPVGTVFFGIATPSGIEDDHQVFAGDRSTIRASTLDHALKLALRACG